MAVPQILVVIPCLNEATHIKPLLIKLLKSQRLESAAFRVVDGGSTDETISIVEDLAKDDPRLRLLHNTKKIQSAAVNLAAAAADPETIFMIRMDAHADYPSNYCDELIDEANAMSADAVVVAMLTIGTMPFQRAVAAAQNSRLGNGGSAHRIGEGEGRWVDHGHHALIRLDAFRAVGGYDETFVANEDAELDLRLLSQKRKIWLTAKTRLTYYPRASAVSLFNQYVGYGYGRASTLLKHHLVPKFRQIVPISILPIIVLTSLAFITLFATLPLLIWASTCCGYGAYLSYRDTDKEMYYVGPALMIMHAAWSFGFWTALCATIVRRNHKEAHD